MSDDLSDELLDSIGPLVQDGSVELQEDQDLFFDIIENNFPVVGSKIAWEKVPGAITKIVNKREFVSECIEFLMDRLRQENIIPSASVVVIGDSAMEYAIVTKAGVLEVLMSKVLELPQHTYVLDLSGQWCMAFTMEGFADFGYKVNK